MVTHRLHRLAPATSSVRRSRILVGSVLPRLMVFRLALVLAVGLLLGASPCTVGAHEATPQAEVEEVPATLEIVAAGLTNPRGFTWGEDGTLYVALAGTGGSTLPTEDAPVIEVFLGFYGGPSAAIARIADGCPVTVAAGLPSYIDGTGGVVGVSDVAILGGQLYATVDGGGTVHGNPEQPAGLYRINADGTFEVVADLSAWMRANPVAERPPGDDDYDGEVWRLLPTADGSAFWVVESNQGQVLQITPAGEITRVADLSVGHPVPTGIAPAPDGGVYVGTLTAFPFLDEAATVVHVAPDGTVTDHWTGLTAVVALAVGPDDALYALEMVTGSTDEDPFILPDSGRIVRQTGSDSLEVVAEGLNFPIGLDFAPDGALHVGLPALGAAPGQGMIARLDLENGSASQGAATPMIAPQCLAVPGP
jgi:DNA-binding beta-propeller fold protein YncE